MAKQLHTLIVEDSEDDALLVVRELKRGEFDPLFERVDTAKAMNEALDKQSWDVVIADYVMPQFSGLDALKLVKKRGLDLPFLIVSGKIGEDIAVEAMKAGAHDYITKGNLSRLVPAINRELREADVRLERRRAEETLLHLSRLNELILNSVEDGIYGMNTEGKTTFVNSAAAKMLGFGVEDLIGRSIHEVMHHSKANETPYLWEKCPVFITIRDGEVHKAIEDLFWRKDGTSFQVELTSSPIKENSKLVGAVITFRDITERKRTEEALKKRDRDIRRAYVDVFNAVTGGKLIIMTLEEIEESLGEPISNAYEISKYEELASARKWLKAIILEKFPNFKAIDDFILAENEALTNAIKHAGGGIFQIYKTKKYLQIMTSDSGPGIDFKVLPKATLLAGYSTKRTLGVGFSIMLDLCDRIILYTQKGCTKIVLGMNYR